MPSGSRFNKVRLKRKTKIVAPTYRCGKLALLFTTFFIKSYSDISSCGNAGLGNSTLRIGTKNSADRSSYLRSPEFSS